MAEVAMVAGDVALAFILPEFGSRSRNDPAILTSVHMPIATMNEDDFLVAEKDDVGMAGKVAAMEGITITHSMNY